MQKHETLFIAPTRIGDAVLASSILRYIEVNYPNSRVTIATSPLAAPLFAGYPLLERVILLEKKSYNRHWLKMWQETVRTSWDTIWDLRNSAVTFLLRAKQRRRFVAPKNTAPKVEQYAQILETGALPYPTLWPTTKDTEAARQLMPEGAPYLVIAPIANWPLKEWPIEHFITLTSTMLTSQYSRYRPVVICAAHERERALPLLNALQAYQPIDLTDGRLPLLSVYACMQRAHGFIGNDSGLMHMAAAAEIPTLGLFGPTPSTIYQPWGKHCAFIASGNGTMSGITPALALEAFNTLVEKSTVKAV